MSTPEPRKSGMLELPRGTAVGKYEILRKLAQGGMAEIYLARVSGTAGFEKLVVLKRILPTVADDPRIVQMFLDEARLAATLRHPNIADVYDVGDDDGVVFFTMEFVHGQDVRSLRQDAKIRQEQIPLGVGLAIVHGTASALEHAHELTGPDGKSLGLVHRDVSSSNVMVSYDGAIKLLDFGIARATSQTHKTQTGTLKGKIAYMSPEQCKGTPVDRRSDLFSLGIVMYELTVGRRPFRGDTDFAIMDQIVYHSAPPPTSIRPDYPADLEAIVMKLLERSPNLRYPTGEDLLHDLDDYVAKNALWQSPRAIGKYMRTVFAEKITAWEKAEQEGLSLGAHVAQSITSQSQRVELMTPSRSFPGIEPRPSQRHMIAHAHTAVQDAVTPPKSAVMPVAAPVSAPEPAAPQPIAQFESGPAVYPSLKPSGTRVALWAFLGVLILGGAGVAGFLLTQKKTASETKPVAGDPATPTTPTTPTTTTATTPTTPTTTTPTTKTTNTTPTATATTTTPTTTTPTTTTPTTTTPATPTTTTTTDVADPGPHKTGKHPVVVKKQVVKKQPHTDPVKTDTTKPPPPKQDPNKPFDPDSPFLPQ